MHFPHRAKKGDPSVQPEKNFPAQVDNLNAKCKPFNAVAPASICRLGVYNIIQKSFKLVERGGKERNCYDNLKEVQHALNIHYSGCKVTLQLSYIEM